MKNFLRSFAAVLCATALLCGAAGAAPATGNASASRWSGSLYAEGQAVYLYNGARQAVPVISFEGSTYIPLRAAGEWAGKTVSWNEETKTAALSSSGVPVYDTAPNKPTAAQQLSITHRPDIRVTLNGTVQTFRSATGQVIYPISYADTTYLPLRSIGQLVGFEVTWVSTAQGQEIYLRTPLTTAQKQKARGYIAAQLTHLQTIDQLIAPLCDAPTDALVQKNTGLIEFELASMQAATLPSVPVLTASDAHLRTALQALADTNLRISKMSAATVSGTAHDVLHLTNYANCYAHLGEMKRVLDQTSAYQLDDVT